ncbi:MAG: diaminopimelate decarboxylase [Rhodothermia bacterium]
MNQKPNLPTNLDELNRAVAAAGTPTVAYDEQTIRARCGEFRDAIASVPSRLLYALKANSNPALVQLLTDEVDGFDVVSPGELELLLRLGVRARNILFSPNYMTDAEMVDAADRGVMLNIGELSRLERFGREFPGSDVCVRLNLWVGAGHHKYVVTGGKDSKFGVPGDQLNRINEIADRYDLTVVGLHQHIGSGFSSADDFADSVDLLMEACKRFPETRFLNVGGGIGIPYRFGESRFDLGAVSARLAASSSAAGLNVVFWFEPGRFLVAESGTLLISVTAVKQSGDRTFAGTDSGFNHLIRPALYNAHHEIVNVSNPSGPMRPYDVAGNICESGDLFARDREIQEIREGDVLAILDVGAYGVSMASEYNMRPLPQEVLIKSDGAISTIRKRMNASQLVDRYLDETGEDSA